MRILHIINSLDIAGAEKLLVDILPMLKDSGYEADLLLLDGRRTVFFEALEKKGIRIFYLDVSVRYYNPLLMVRLIPWVRRYQLIHAHIFPTQYWVAGAALLGCSKAKLITTEHSTHNRRREIPFFRSVDRWVFNRYKKIISISAQTTDSLASYLGTSESIVTIPNGIDAERFRNVDRFLASLPNEKPDCFRIVQVAAFRPEKDQDTLIRAIALLPEKYQVWFVGDGVRRLECEELANALNVSQRVIFTGLRGDVPEFLHRCDLVVLSSHWEGFGLAAVEGMAAGKPVIASDVSGLREVVEGAGITVKPGDEKALAEAISNVMENRELYAELVEKGHLRAKQYDIREMVVKYISVYNQLLSNN